MSDEKKDPRLIRSVDIYEVGEFKRDENGNIVFDEEGEPIWFPPPIKLDPNRWKPE